MAKAFTESGRETIRKALLEKGREYFIRYGLKKTGIDELTRAVGIAKGSFYTFFDSKEALFMAIHEETENTLQQKITGKLDQLHTPSEILTTFFTEAFRFIEEDPLMRAALSGGEIGALSTFMTTDNFRDHYKNDLMFLEELIKTWQAQNIVRSLDPAAVSSMIASVYYIVLQKEALGDEMYQKVIRMLIESLVNYLKAGD